MGAKKRRKVAAATVTPVPEVSPAWLKLTTETAQDENTTTRAPIDRVGSRTPIELHCGCRGSWLRLPMHDEHGYFERFIPDKSCIEHMKKDRPLHELSRDERKWHYPEGRCYHCGVRGPDHENHAWFCYWWNGPGRNRAPF